MAGINGNKPNNLIETLVKGNKETRLLAVIQLGTHSDKEAVELLKQIILNKGEDKTIRAHALSSLAKQNQNDESIFNILIAALKDSESIIRAYAATALANRNDARAVDLLLEVLNQDISRVRWAAATALGKTGSYRAVEPLIQALRDRSKYVRLHTALALGNIGDRRAIEPLLQLLQKDSEPLVRFRVAEALSKFGEDEQILKSLKAVAETDKAEALYGRTVSNAALEALNFIRQDLKSVVNPEIASVSN